MARARAAKQMQEGEAAAPAGAPSGGGVVPFVQGSKPEIEPGPSFSAVKPGASSIELGSVPIPANGFIGAILVDCANEVAGTIGAGVVRADYPFNVLELVRLTEPNGAPLGLELSGWQTFLADTYGGYAGSPDCRNDPDYTASTTVPSFTLRIPVEISANALGVLGNQSASAALRLTLKVAPLTTIYSTNPTTAPTFKITTWIELWGEPPREDMFGRQVMQEPPYSGTAQYWSVQAESTVNTAQNTIRLTRVGSQIRTIIFDFRGSGTPFVRSDAVAPDPFEIQLDNRLFRQYSRRMLRKIMRESVQSLTARDTGVYALLFSKGEHKQVGENEINSWLGTLTATRLELRGPAEAAGTVNILTNDISVTSPSPAGRTQQVNAGAYHPPIGESSPAAV